MPIELFMVAIPIMTTMVEEDMIVAEAITIGIIINLLEVATIDISTVQEEGMMVGEVGIIIIMKAGVVIMVGGVTLIHIQEIVGTVVVDKSIQVIEVTIITLEEVTVSIKVNGARGTATTERVLV